uniref:Uncharacterized protein n=1 Tax=Oryza punctata TaxID=4537 RepID=A0A0E0KGP0_ORYPU
MAQEGKLDLLLKTVEENKKRRVEAKERARVDFVGLKVVVEGRLPQVEKKVSDLGKVLGVLSTKVEQLESTVSRQARAELLPEDIREEHLDASPSLSTPLIRGSV